MDGDLDTKVFGCATDLHKINAGSLSGVGFKEYFVSACLTLVLNSGHYSQCSSSSLVDYFSFKNSHRAPWSVSAAQMKRGGWSQS